MDETKWLLELKVNGEWVIADKFDSETIDRIVKLVKEEVNR